MRPVSQAANNINWLINNFVERVPGVQEAVVVSTLSRAEQEQLNGLLRKLLAGFGDDDEWKS